MTCVCVGNMQSTNSVLMLGTHAATVVWLLAMWANIVRGIKCLVMKQMAKCLSTCGNLIMLQLLVRWRWVGAGVVHTFWHAVGQWGYICCGKGSCVFVAGQDYHAWCSWWWVLLPFRFTMLLCWGWYSPAPFLIAFLMVVVNFVLVRIIMSCLVVLTMRWYW